MAVGESVIEARMSVVRTFTEVEAAWLAAAIDGEGYIRIYSSYSDKNGRRITSIRVGISMTSKEFLKYAKSIVGVGILREKKPYKNHWKLQYTFDINGWSAVPVLEQILPYLIIKKEKAISAIAEMEMKRADFDG